VLDNWQCLTIKEPVVTPGMKNKWSHQYARVCNDIKENELPVGLGT
jgi:hypothetical protein